MIRAKFKCHTVTRDSGGNETVTLHPVYGNAQSPDNIEWSKYTPTGKLEMTITQEGAQGKFIPNKDYFLDFTPAEG
jgi:hypothetical protein